jgi:hypothetical protein
VPWRLRSTVGAGTVRCAEPVLRDVPARVCERCSNPARSKHAKLCEACKRAANVANRQQARRWERANPRPPRGPQRTAAAQRMYKRLRAEREGHEIEPVEWSGTRPDSREFPNLSAGPLIAAIDRLIRREAVAFHGDTDVWRLKVPSMEGRPIVPEKISRGDGALSVAEAVCARLDISTRTLREWRDGRRPSVRFDVADRIVTRAGWLWFDVWSDDEQARRAFEGE